MIKKKGGGSVKKGLLAIVVALICAGFWSYPKSKSTVETHFHPTLNHFPEESRKWLQKQNTTMHDIRLIASDEKKVRHIFHKISSITKQIKKTKNEALLPEFAHKNRRHEFIPFDDNRTCKHLPNFYLNGSEVITPEQNYIVLQGPLDHTIKDFWQAMIHRDVPLIVTTTMDIEEGQPKCANYWKTHLPITVDEYTIDLESERVIKEKTVFGKGMSFVHRLVKRSFLITSQVTKKQKSIIQLHYENWPDSGIPDLELFCTLLDQVDKQHVHAHIPIAVHCSAGIGRSGTFVAAHTLRKSIHKKKNESSNLQINIPLLVVHLRLQRYPMISSPAQLQVVYQALYHTKP